MALTASSVEETTELDLLKLFEKDAADESRPDSSWNNLLTAANLSASSESLNVPLDVLEMSMGSMVLTDSQALCSTNSLKIVDSHIFSSSSLPKVETSPTPEAKDKKEKVSKRASKTEHRYDGKIGMNLLQTAYDQHDSYVREKAQKKDSQRSLGLDETKEDGEDKPNAKSLQDHLLAMQRKAGTGGVSSYGRSQFLFPHDQVSRESRQVSFLASSQASIPFAHITPQATTSPSSNPYLSHIRGKPAQDTVFGVPVEPLPFNAYAPSGLSNLGFESNTPVGSVSSHPFGQVPSFRSGRPTNSGPGNMVSRSEQMLTPTSSVKDAKAAPTKFSASAEAPSATGFPKFLNTTVCKGQKFPPLRPLSAYNYFFREERDRLLRGELVESQSPQERRMKLLLGHWGQDRTQKRPHRKSHGKISFSELTRVISTRWKSLSVADQTFYKEIARVDMERFKNETCSEAQKNGNKQHKK